MFHEIRARLAERYDATELVSLLELESVELVEAFGNKIKANLQEFSDLVDDDQDANDLLDSSN